MKKITLVLFVLASLTLAMACSSDDEGSTAATEQLKVTVDGNMITINSVEVIQLSSTDRSVVATDNNTNTEFRFAIGVGEIGEDAIYQIVYEKDDVEHWTESGTYSSNISVNNGSRVEFTFSGPLQGYNTLTGETIYVTLENGSLFADY